MQRRSTKLIAFGHDHPVVTGLGCGGLVAFWAALGDRFAHPLLFVASGIVLAVLFWAWVRPDGLADRIFGRLD